MEEYDRCDTSTIDLLELLLPTITVSEDFSKKQLFRHESELKDKKGGYLQGQVFFPPGKGTILINCSPAKVDPGELVDFQPNLLLVSKMKRGQKRRRQSNGSMGGHSPDSTEDEETKVTAGLWKIKLLQTSSGDIYWRDTIVGSNSTLTFDSTIFPVTIMIPLQSGNSNGRINIKQVLESIDNSGEFAQSATTLEQEFKRNGKFKMHQVRLRFKIEFEDEKCPSVIGYTENILNQKHSSTGSLEINKVLPYNQLCNHQQESIFILLVTKLDSVDASLVITGKDETKQTLNQLLIQPSKPIIHHKVLVEVIIPVQRDDIYKMLTREPPRQKDLCLVLQLRDEKKDVPIIFGKFNSCETCRRNNEEVVNSFLPQIAWDGHKQPKIPAWFSSESASPVVPLVAPRLEPTRVINTTQGEILPKSHQSWWFDLLPVIICIVGILTWTYIWL